MSLEPMSNIDPVIKKPLTSRHSFWLFNLLLLGNTALFIASLFAPLMTISKLIWVTNTVSIVSGIQDLVAGQEWLLFLLIVLFSILFPFAKLLTIGLVWNIDFRQPVQHSYTRIRWLEALGKWSMLDVFLVAILVSGVKLGMLAEVTVHYGLYLFALSVILMMLLSGYLSRKLHALKAWPSRPAPDSD